MCLDRDDEEDVGVVVPRPCITPNPIATGFQTHHHNESTSGGSDVSLPEPQSPQAPSEETPAGQRGNPIKYPTRRRSRGNADGRRSAIRRLRAIAGTKRQRMLRMACCGRKKMRV